jgi:hypothetical protein
VGGSWAGALTRATGVAAQRAERGTSFRSSGPGN